MDEKRSCITINCGCCGPVSDAGNAGQEDGTPAGTIIAYMGTKAPKHYLVCDGGVYKIADFPVLSKQIIDEFGVVDYFGGDGVETFAVPDLRNEFLRGYHGEAGEQLTGNIGEHQEPTEIPFTWRGDTSDPSFCTYNPNISLTQKNQDKDITGNPSKQGLIIRNLSTFSSENTIIKYTTRPTNVAVLYCIKYE